MTNDAELEFVAKCVAGDGAALSTFERDYVSRLRPTIARIDGDDAFIDEALQQLRTRLLMGEKRLQTFAGQAPLMSWLRAVAVRIALNVRRAAPKYETSDDDALELVSATGPEPELLVLRQRHGPEFREAFRAALARLSVRERNVLRLQALDGLTMAQIGRLHSVNKSTVSRWLTQIHEALANNTREVLGTRLALDAAQLDSLMRAMRSNLELSLSDADVP